MQMQNNTAKWIDSYIFFVPLHAFSNILLLFFVLYNNKF